MPRKLQRHARKYFPKKKDRQLTRWQRKEILSGEYRGSSRRTHARELFRSPRSLSVIDSPNETVALLDRLERCLNRPDRPPIYLDNRNVSTATPDGVAATILQTLRFDDVRGNIPNVEPARAIFKESGVFASIRHGWADDCEIVGSVSQQARGTEASGDYAKKVVAFAVAV